MYVYIYSINMYIRIVIRLYEFYICNDISDSQSHFLP